MRRPRFRAVHIPLAAAALVIAGPLPAHAAGQSADFAAIAAYRQDSPGSRTGTLTIGLRNNGPGSITSTDGTDPADVEVRIPMNNWAIDLPSECTHETGARAQMGVFILCRTSTSIPAGYQQVFSFHTNVDMVGMAREFTVSLRTANTPSTVNVADLPFDPDMSNNTVSIANGGTSGSIPPPPVVTTSPATPTAAPTTTAPARRTRTATATPTATDTTAPAESASPSATDTTTPAATDSGTPAPSDSAASGAPAGGGQSTHLDRAATAGGTGIGATLGLGLLALLIGGGVIAAVVIRRRRGGAHE